MKEELFIIIEGERKQLDLNTPSGITLNYKSNVFGDISSIENSYSYTFTLPNTRNNATVLDNYINMSSLKLSPFHVEYHINGVPVFKDARIYIEAFETHNGYNAKIIWNISQGLKRIKENDISIRDLPGADYNGSVFGDKETDDILYDVSPFVYYRGQEKRPKIINQFDKIQNSGEFPPEFSLQARTPLYRPIYGAGLALVKNANGDVISSTSNTSPGPFYEWKNTILTPPPVASVPFLLAKISDFFGLNISADGAGLEKYCLPFAKMGQTKCLMRQNYIEFSIGINSAGNVSVVKDNKNVLVLNEIKDLEINNAVSLKAINAEIRPYDIDVSVFSEASVIAAPFFVKHLIGYKGTIHPCVAYRGGMGEHTFLSGCIKITYEVDVTQKKNPVEQIPVLALKVSRYSISGWNTKEVMIDTAYEEDTEVKEVAASGFKERAKEIEKKGVLYSSTVKGIGNADNKHYTGFFTVIYEMREEFGADIIEFEETLESNRAIFFTCEAEYSFAVKSVDTAQLRIYTGDDDLLTLQRHSNLGHTKSAMNFYKNLPDITCSELLSALSFASGCYLFFDEKSNTLFFRSRNVLWENIYTGFVRNLTSRLIFKEQKYDKNLSYDRSALSNIGDFGKTTYFLMGNDKLNKFNLPEEDEYNEDFYKHSYGKMLFAGEDIPDAATFVNVPFYGALVSRYKARGLDTGDTTDYWNVQASTFPGDTRYAITKVEANETKPFLGMFVPQPIYENGDYFGLKIWQFPENMEASAEWRMLFLIWEHPYIVEEYMELTEFDLRGVDYTVPVYLDKYSSYFGIIDIERYDDGICKVTMFKLLFGKDYTIKYEPYILIMPKQGGYDYAWDDEVWVTLKIKAYYYKQGETEPFKSFNVDLAEDDIKVIFDHKYGDEEWYWDKERHTVVLTANPEAEQSYHVQMFFEVNIQGEVLDLSDKAVSYNRLYQQ